MKNGFQLRLMLAATLLAAGSAMAADNGPAESAADAQIMQKVVHEIRMYPRYTIWDNVTLAVHNGEVDLQGQVSQPFKKALWPPFPGTPASPGPARLSRWGMS